MQDTGSGRSGPSSEGNTSNVNSACLMVYSLKVQPLTQLYTIFTEKKNLFHKVINLRLKITTPSACLPNKTDKSPKFTGSLDR